MIHLVEIAIVSPLHKCKEAKCILLLTLGLEILFAYLTNETLHFTLFTRFDINIEKAPA